MDLSQEEWKHKLENDDNAFLLDVRTLEEFEEGHIPNARLLDIRQAGKTKAQTYASGFEFVEQLKDDTRKI